MATKKIIRTIASDAPPLGVYGASLAVTPKDVILLQQTWFGRGGRSVDVKFPSDITKVSASRAREVAKFFTAIAETLENI